ncbi:hypothetical protein NUW58_g4421 [Xylaria curta]|uniref:Uncharacterized protein n=1 Tax=Xylaria curta TaxID=42375 RepID=A0ACC1P7Q3_9PEZI|nr:hypothetical protein NUW58_g4421 [Xylaria curta]
MNSNERRVPKRWTEEEDCILYEETQKQELAGETKDWHRIAAKLPGRTNKDCRKRWVNKVCGSLKKGAWNKNEDERLLDAVDRHGQKWTLVANAVGFRSPDQCAKRWQSKLDPNLEHGGWTIEEDELLLNLVQENGREWKMFQEQNFSRRSTNELKNRQVLSMLFTLHLALLTIPQIYWLSPSMSSNSDNNGDAEDHDRVEEDCDMDGQVRNLRKDSAVGSLTHQDLTVGWVDTLDDPNMWMDQFSHRHNSIGEDIIPSGYLAESDGPMDHDKQRKRLPISDESTAPTTSHRRHVSGSIDPAAWPDLVFDPEIVSGIASATQDAMMIDSSYGIHNNVLEDALLVSAQRDSGSTSRTDESIATEYARIPTESSVGRVTLVIDGCNRDTLHSLLDLTRTLKGKTKIEID